MDSNSKINTFNTNEITDIKSLQEAAPNLIKGVDEMTETVKKIRILVEELF